MGTEICDNGRDDNNDRLVDCADPQCTTFPGCLTISCTPEVEFGAIPAHGANVARTFDTRNATVAFDTCAPTGGFGRVGRFTLTETTDLKLDFSQPGGSAHVVGLYRAGAGQSCERNPVACVDVGGAATGTRSFPGLAAGAYWVIVDSYPSVPGATTVTLSTGALAMPEVCANGRDDDGNGLTDCQDAVCLNDVSCVGSECVPDLNIGALVLDGPSKQVMVELATSADRYHPTCGGNNAGGDKVIALTIPAPAGLYVRFQQTGRSLFSLFGMPARGWPATPISCRAWPRKVPSAGIAWVNLPAGTLPARREGARGRAGRHRQHRLLGHRWPTNPRPAATGSTTIGMVCTDCADPTASVSAVARPRPACPTPTSARCRGTSSGRSPSIPGPADALPTSCSRGTGKEKVLRLNLTQPMGLGVDCVDNGSHVLDAGPAAPAARHLQRQRGALRRPVAAPARSAATTRSRICSPASTTSSSRLSRLATRGPST